MLCDGHFAATFELARGARGRDADDAGRRVLAEQRALRPAQHFDTLNVSEVGKALRLAHGNDAINDGRYRRFNALTEEGGADATNTKAAVGGRCTLLEGQRRDGLHQRGAVVDLAVRKRVPRNGSDREWYVLQPLCALLRGDDDVGAGIIVVDCGHRCILRKGRNHVGGGERRDQPDHGRTGQTLSDLRSFHSTSPLCLSD